MGIDLASLGIRIDASGAILQSQLLGASLDATAAKAQPFIVSAAQSEAAWKRASGSVSAFNTIIAQMKAQWEAANTVAAQSAPVVNTAASAAQGLAQASTAAGRAMAQQEIAAHKLNDSMTAATSATGKMTAASSSLQGIALGLAATLAAIGLAGAGKGILDTAARYETLGVAMNVVGRNAGYTAGQMAGFQTALEKTGISMVASREAMSKMAAAQLDLSKASALGRVAQDAAVIANINSSDAFERLVQGIVSGQPRVLRTMGIFADFGREERKWAEQHDRSRDSLTQTELVQIRLSAALTEGAKRAGAYEASMETAGKQLKSTERYLDDLRVKVGTAFLPEYTRAVFGYANGLKFLGENASGVVGVVTGMATAIGLVAVAVTAVKVAGLALAATPLGLALSAVVLGLAVAAGAAAKVMADARGQASRFSESLATMAPTTIVASIHAINEELSLYQTRMARFKAFDGRVLDKDTEHVKDLTAMLRQLETQQRANTAASESKTSLAADAARELAEAKAAEARDAAEKERIANLKMLQAETDKYYNAQNTQRIGALASIAVAKQGTADMRDQIDAAQAGTLAERMLADAKAERVIVEKFLVDTAKMDAGERDARLSALLAEIRQTQALSQALSDEAQARAAAAQAAKDAQKVTDDAIKASLKATLDAQQTAEKAAAAETVRQAHDVDRALRATFSTFFSDIFTTGQNAFQSLFDAIRKGFIKLVADFAANRLTVAIMGRTITESSAGVSDASVAVGGGASRAAGIAGAGLAGLGVGYGIGASTQGNRGSSALFGALGGAAAGAAVGTAIAPGVGTVIGAVVGSIAGLVGGIVGAGHAADLSAKEMRNLQQTLTTSLASVRAQLNNDALGGALAQLKEQFNALRKAAEDAYATGENEAKRNEVLAELNALEAKRAQQLRDEAALLQTQAQEDYRVRTLVAQGRLAEADALAYAEKQQREYAAAVKSGADEVTKAALLEAQSAERMRYAADQARAEGRAQEDPTLRAAIARKDEGVEALVRAAQQRREIEDLVTKGASAATIALTKLAQAAEDAAIAAQKAADAQQKLAEQARAVEDINVELLNAQGKTSQAADLQFKLDQQRRLEEAQKNQSAEYVKKLIELQQLQRDGRAAQGLIDSTTGPSGGGGRQTGVTAALTSVQATVTERTAYQLVDLSRSQLTVLQKIERNTARFSGSASLSDINQGLGSLSVAQGLYSGSVSR